MTVNVSATFKEDVREYNGLEAIREELVKDPLRRHVVAAVVETKKIVRDIAGGGTETPTIRVVHIEALDGDQAEQVRELLNKVFEQRTGYTPETKTLFDDPDEDRREDEA